MTTREDSAPKIRRLLSEAQERIRELESAPPVVVEVVKEVRVEVPVVTERTIQLPPVHTVTEKIVYQDNPEHIETIRRLQERLCQFTSQSAS